MKVAFVVQYFPLVSQTFIIDQVADLINRGVEVVVFSFNKGKVENVSQKFYKYNMLDKVHYLETPLNIFRRFFLAIPKIIHIVFTHPELLLKIFNFKKYRREAFSLQLLFWIEPFINKKFDLFHCHFGHVANDFLKIKEILGLRQKIFTTFYGWDVSYIFQKEPANYYDKLKKECSLFFVMSNNMKDRIIERGFDQKRIKVLPVGIDVKSYPYKKRALNDGELINIISVGRFVEKKGFDDLLQALAIVKAKSKKLFKCYIIGDGSQKVKLFNLTERLKLSDVVEYKGYMKIEDVINYFSNMHLFVQPSKKSRSGDME